MKKIENIEKDIRKWLADPGISIEQKIEYIDESLKETA